MKNNDESSHVTGAQISEFRLREGVVGSRDH